MSKPVPVYEVPDVVYEAVPNEFAAIVRLNRRSGPSEDSDESVTHWSLGHMPAESRRGEPRPLYMNFR